MSIGKTMLGRRHVLPSVTTSLTELMVEGTFPSGTYLVTVHQPISSNDGDLEKALYGSFLPIPSKDQFPLPDVAEYESRRLPGAVIPIKEERVVLRDGRTRIRLKVTSKGDRPIQVGHWRCASCCTYCPKTTNRLAPITTLLKQIRSSISIVLEPTATFWT